MISDIFLVTGFGLTNPILAIFIKDNIVGGTIFMASLAATIYMVIKCLVQLPFSKYVDKHDHKVKWVIIGTFMIAVVPFVYMFANDMKTVFLAQIIHGIGSGLVYPTWLGLWSTHLDKKHESFEWSLYSTLVTLGSAGAAIIGGIISQSLGFKLAFFFVFLLSLVGAFILFYLKRKDTILPKAKFTHYQKKRRVLSLGQ